MSIKVRQLEKFHFKISKILVVKVIIDEIVVKQIIKS